MVDDKDTVQLSEYCFNTCEVLKTAVQGKDVNSLNESVRVALEDLERCVDWSCSVCSLTNSNSRVTREIERTLRRGANIPRAKHNKGKVEEQKLRIQGIFDTLNAPSASLDETIPVNSYNTATSSIPESGAPSAPPSQILYGVLITHTLSQLQCFSL